MKISPADLHLDNWKLQLVKAAKGFVKDGILNPELYSKAAIKVCFLCKDANLTDSTDDHDCRIWLKDGAFTTFYYRLQEWAGGIQDDFPPIEELSEEAKHDAFMSSAIVNVKKTGGKGVAVYEDILHHAVTYKKLLHEQLSHIKPDMIILGLSYKEIREAVFPNVKWKSSGYHCDVALWKGIRLIDFYHPSSRNAPAASYSLLQNVINSNAFKTLIP